LNGADQIVEENSSDASSHSAMLDPEVLVAPGADFRKQFRAKFTDKTRLGKLNYKFVNIGLMAPE
jgi:hypothetical protein